MQPCIVFNKYPVILIEAEITGKTVIALVDFARYLVRSFQVFCLLAAVVFHQQRKADYLQYQEQQEYKKPSDQQKNITQGMVFVFDIAMCRPKLNSCADRLSFHCKIPLAVIA